MTPLERVTKVLTGTFRGRTLTNIEADLIVLCSDIAARCCADAEADAAAKERLEIVEMLNKLADFYEAKNPASAAVARNMIEAIEARGK